MIETSLLLKARKLAPLLVIAAGLLAYHNSFSGSYFHDDFRSIPENPTIRQLWPIWECLSPSRLWGLAVQGRPVVNLSLAINYALGGYNVWGYHALNLTVHILAGLTLFGIVRRTLDPEVGTRFIARAIHHERSTASIWPRRSAALPDDASLVALAVALLWTIHPLQTESVTYIIQRAESMMGLFYLLTLYCFIRGIESTVGTEGAVSGSLVGTRFIARAIHHERSTASMAALERSPTNNVAELELGPTGSAALPSTRWFALSVAACALGMATKEVMVSAPLMVMLYDRAFVSGSFREAWQRRRPLYLGLAATWILFGYLLMLTLGSPLTHAERTGLSPWKYLATEPGVILYYLRLSVWPSPLLLDRPWRLATTWISILPSAAVVVILLGASIWAWRRNPAPFRAGPVWGFLGAWFFLILAPSSSFVPIPDPIYEHRMYLSLAAVMSVVVIGLYSVMGRRSLAVFLAVAVGLGFLTWRRNQDYRKNPDFSLALALQRAGRIQEALGYYERALRASPNDADAHYNYGATLMQVGRLQEAINHYEQALRIAPGFPEVHYNLGLAMVELGRTADAIGHYEQALRMKPDYAEAHNNLGIVLAGLGNLPGAVDHFTEAVRINPGYAEAHNNLGNALMRLGRQQEAMAHWELALKLKPDYAQAHDNFGVALAELGRLPEAVEQFTEAVRINPGYAEAHYNLGLTLEKIGRIQEAIAHYEEALQIKPDFAEAKNRLARLRTAR